MGGWVPLAGGRRRRGIVKSAHSVEKILDEQGFVVAPAPLPDMTVASLHAEIERLVAGDPQSSFHERGARRAKAALNNAVFAVCWRHRVVLDAARGQGATVGSAS
jgi:hypothetical protein